METSELARLLQRQLEKDEGRKNKMYKDSRGYWTVGVGILMDPRVEGSGLRDHEVSYLYGSRLNETMNELKRELPNLYSELDGVRRAALINMTYQLGINRLLKFKKMLAALKDSDWQLAKTEALDSDWAKQTPARAARMAQQLLTGEFDNAYS